MILYHCKNARSFRPLWTLEELGLDYELKMLPFPPRVLARDYMAINPLGTIPTFLDGETKMTESAAICHYLVARHAPTPLNVEPHEPAFGAFLNFLHFGEATLTYPQTIVFRYRDLEPPERRLPQAAEDYAKWFLARLRGVDAIVSRADYICANRFTAADISVGYALKFAAQLKLDGGFSAPVQAYWARLTQREGYQRAMAAQDSAAREQGVADRVPVAE